jgi:uncharacterized protein YggE
MKDRARLTRMAMATALLAVGAAPAVFAQAPAEPPVVTVTGEGVVRRAPDVAHVVLVAESHNQDPRVAQRDAASAMTAVRDRLRQAGIADEALRTRSYDLVPEYDFVNNQRTLRGYVARNRLEVRVDDLTRVGELLDVGVQAGATSVEGLRFDLKARGEAEREALRLAAADAWARAQAAAAGVGRTVDRVVRIAEPGLSMPGPLPQALSVGRAAEMQAEPPPIQPGDIEIRARVTLTATLK